MLIVGDSHTRRLAAHRSQICRRVESIQLSFLHRGGVGIQYGIDRTEEARLRDIVIIMLANGMSIPTVIRQLEDLANGLLRHGAQHVVITAIWPRQNRLFNDRARQVTEQLSETYRNHPRITLWLTERRLSMMTIDGVHLRPNAYRRAAIYIASCIIWVIRNRLQTQ